jgi:hypothetical protein
MLDGGQTLLLVWCPAVDGCVRDGQPGSVSDPHIVNAIDLDIRNGQANR